MSDKDLAVTEIKKISDEYFVEIPDRIAEKLDLKEGDTVDVSVENGTLVIRKYLSLFKYCEVLPTDYEFYGGEIVKDLYEELVYGDCSECKCFMKLENNSTYGICSKINSPRIGKLTHKFQAGFNCCEK